MTDGQTLLAVFAAFYLLECLWMVNARAWIARGAEHTKWRFSQAFDRLQFAGGAPVLLAPLPPFKAHLHALPWLFLPRAEALGIVQGDGTEAAVAWDEVKPRVEDHTLHVGGSVRVRLPSEAAARHWEQLLTEWRGLTPEKRRAAFLKHARESLDAGKVAQLVEKATQRTRWLRLVGEVVFLWCFGVIAVTYRWLGEHRTTYAVIATLPLFTLTQTWLFLRVTKRHAVKVPHRPWRALGMVFLPHQAARAADLVTLAHEHLPHPLAFHAQMEQTAFVDAARRFWRAARYVPGWKTAETPPVEVEALEKFFHSQKLAESDYDPAPELGAHAVAWCPCCHAPFLKADVPCRDCSGVDLKVKEAA